MDKKLTKDAKNKVAKKPKKWTEVYPQGSQEGDEEQRFFIALARNPKFEYRSTEAIAKEASLSKERTEEIIQKYLKKSIVFQNPKNEAQWAYWERVPELLAKDDSTITQADQKKRVDKALGCEVTNAGQQSAGAASDLSKSEVMYGKRYKACLN